jgi:hypothetical protein
MGGSYAFAVLGLTGAAGAGLGGSGTGAPYEPLAKPPDEGARELDGIAGDSVPPGDGA